MNSRTILSALGALVLTACTAGAPPSTAPTGLATDPPATLGTATSTPATAATPTAPATAPATSPPTPPATAPTAAVTFAPGTALASLLPTEVAGQALTIDVTRDSWTNFLYALGPDNAQAILDKFDASQSDAEFAGAVTNAEIDPDNPQLLYIHAFRLRGVEGDALLAEMIPVLLESVTYMVASTETIAGRVMTVLRPRDPADRSLSHYFWAVGDVVFDVTGRPQEWVDEAFTKLP